MILPSSPRSASCIMPPSFTVAFMSHMSGRTTRYATPPAQEFRPCPEVYVAESGLFFRSEEHTSELQSLMRISYAVFCLKKKKHDRRMKHRMKQRQAHNIKTLI